MRLLSSTVFGAMLGVALYIVPGAVIFKLPEDPLALGLALVAGALIGVVYEYGG
jgi:hypothetical protein